MSLNTICRALFLVSFISIFSTGSYSQITLTPFVSNVVAVTDITNCGDDRIFIVEQAGRIQISDLQGNLNPVPYLRITGRVLDGGERGLLGLAFSPNYQVDGRFYVNYTNNQGNSVISRFNVSASDPDIADSLNEEILFTVVQPYSNHNGGAMFFGKDGYLYISFGDGGNGGDPGNRAQNPTEHLGKLLRINVDVPTGYSIPATNPYFGSSVNNPKIWNLGLRNAWKVNKDRLTGDIWIADVGQEDWEEVNFQPYSSTGGENYGWRCYEGNTAYNTVGCQPQGTYDEPVYVFPHPPSCSVTGGYVYRGAVHASLYGKYFFTDYCDGELRSLTPNGSGGFNFTSHGVYQTLSFVTFGEDKYGELYIGKTTSGVLKMSTSGCLPVASIATQDTITQCGTSYTFTTPAGQGFLYQWYFNGAVIPGASTNTYTATQSGNYSVQAVSATFCTATSPIVYLDLIPAPAVSFSGLPSILCINAATVSLNGSPSGGVFSGNGITGSDFDAATATVGTHIISYTYDNGNGCILTSNQTVVVDACLFTPEIPSASGFYISPNPATDHVNFVWSGATHGSISFDVYDVSGKLQSTIVASENLTEITLDTNELASGVYVVKMNNEGKSSYRKLVIQ